MHRKKFLKHGGLGAVLTAGSAQAIAQASPEVRWRLASSDPKTLDTLIGSVDLVAKRVAELTSNRYQIKVFGSGEIVPALQVLDAVQNATAECG